MNGSPCQERVSCAQDTTRRRGGPYKTLSQIINKTSLPTCFTLRRQTWPSQELHKGEACKIQGGNSGTSPAAAVLSWHVAATRHPRHLGSQQRAEEQSLIMHKLVMRKLGTR